MRHVEHDRSLGVPPPQMQAGSGFPLQVLAALVPRAAAGFPLQSVTRNAGDMEACLNVMLRGCSYISNVAKSE